MDYIDAILLGFVQGITEFIPVSSSGHLILADSFFATESSFGFDVLLNVGTLGALLVYFRQKLLSIVMGVVSRGNWQLIKNIAISTVPAVAFGYFLSDQLGGGSFRNAGLVAVMLFVVGLVMVLEPRMHKTREGGLDSVTPKKAMSIGLAQALALIPGTSRSGATILAGRFSGLSNEKSAEYSFLIAIPILSGALLKTLLEAETWLVINSSQGLLAVGITTAFVTGYFAIAVMLKYLQKHDLALLGYYRIAIALLVLLTLV